MIRGHTSLTVRNCIIRYLDYCLDLPRLLVQPKHLLSTSQHISRHLNYSWSQQLEAYKSRLLMFRGHYFAAPMVIITITLTLISNNCSILTQIMIRNLLASSNHQKYKQNRKLTGLMCEPTGNKAS